MLRITGRIGSGLQASGLFAGLIEPGLIAVVLVGLGGAGLIEPGLVAAGHVGLGGAGLIEPGLFAVGHVGLGVVPGLVGLWFSAMPRRSFVRGGIGTIQWKYMLILGRSK
jgi:hypothetical protein